MGTLESQFNQDMIEIYHICRNELGYKPNRYLQLVYQKGGLQAAKQLIAKQGGTYGFEILWENKRLDLSVEALVLKPKYSELFTFEEKEICRKLLKEYEYEIEGGQNDNY